MILGVTQIARCHVEQIVRHLHIVLGHQLEAATLEQADGGIDDRFGGKAVLRPDLEPENVADEMKRADLAPAVREQFVAPYRTALDLVNVVGGLLLTEDFGALPVAEFVQIDSDGRSALRFGLAKNVGKFGKAGTDAGEHGPSPGSMRNTMAWWWSGFSQLERRAAAAPLEIHS